MATTPVFLPGESHGQRSLVGCKESDTTELLGTHVVGITSSSNQVVAELFCVELLKF